VRLEGGLELPEESRLVPVSEVSSTTQPLLASPLCFGEAWFESCSGLWLGRGLDGWGWLALAACWLEGAPALTGWPLFSRTSDFLAGWAGCGSGCGCLAGCAWRWLADRLPLMAGGP